MALLREMEKARRLYINLKDPIYLLHLAEVKKRATDLIPRLEENISHHTRYSIFMDIPTIIGGLVGVYGMSFHMDWRFPLASGLVSVVGFADVFRRMHLVHTREKYKGRFEEVLETPTPESD